MSFKIFDTNYAVLAANISRSLPEPSVQVDYVNTAGKRERILNAIRYDPVRQILDGVWSFETLGGTGEVVERRQRPLHVRCTFEREILHLLCLCGFEVMDILADTTGDQPAMGVSGCGL